MTAALATAVPFVAHCAAAPPAEQPADAAAGVDLGPRFDAEPSTTYEHVVHIVQERSVQTARTERLTADLTRRFTMRVLEVHEDGGATIAMAFNRIQLVVTPPDGEPFEFDSRRADDQNPAGARSAMLRRMMGLAVRVRVDRLGQFVSIENDAELDAALGGRSERTDLAPLFDKSAFKDTVEEVWGFAGDPPRRSVGEHWVRQSLTEVGGQTNVPVRLDCTLNGVKNGVASISGTGVFDLGELRPLVEGLTTTVKSQMLQFDIRWNLRLGRVDGYRTAQTLALSQGRPEVPISAVFVSNGELKRVVDGD